MKLIQSPYKVACSKCGKMTKDFVIKDEQIICPWCLSKKYANRSKRPKLTKEQIASIRKNLKEYENNKPKVKILYGGCFK